MRLIMLFCYSGKPVFIVYVENKHVLGVLSIELLVYIVNTKLQSSSLFCRLLIKLMFELRSYKSLYSNFQPFTLKVPYLLPQRMNEKLSSTNYQVPEKLADSLRVMTNPEVPTMQWGTVKFTQVFLILYTLICNAVLNSIII